MSSSTFLLSVNGAAAVTLTTYGIRNPVLEKASLDVGVFRFDLPKNDITTSLGGWTYGSSLVLYRNGSSIFVGRIRQVACSLNAKEALFTVTAFDSWWEMERTIYRQPTTVYVPTGELIGYLSTRVVLNQDAWGRSISQGQQMQNALVYGAYANQGIVTVVAVPDGSTMPVEETREISIAEAVRRAASLTPGYIQYADYSSGIWSQVSTARGSLSIVTLDLNPAFTKITGIQGLRSMQDAVPVGVVFDFLKKTTTAAGEPRVQLERQAAGNPGAFNTIYATFNITDCTTPVPFTASLYYQALQVPHWTGSITLKEDECSGSVAVGNRVNISGGQAAWATMRAVVRRTIEDLENGITTIELGPPEALGVDDFVQQILRFRNRPQPTGFCSVQHNGTEGVDHGIDDLNNQTDPPDGSGGSQAGVTGGATGSTGGSPTGNDNAGNPSGGQLGVSRFTALETCSGDVVNVLTV